ncbi:hypothetical protein HPB51_006296 [Rhipicephalus microplus]|uniref:Uncharacterized protein n=1 Tax=Rhipicephalus microplus TaxID=6941 RepID=A0A9J6EN11_RHIMP|nr:hypothetical protein HPB51_006296 [Rhipicephalus microplus]
MADSPLWASASKAKGSSSSSFTVCQVRRKAAWRRLRRWNDRIMEQPAVGSIPLKSFSTKDVPEKKLPAAPVVHAPPSGSGQMPQLPKGKPEVKGEPDPKRASKRESKAKGGKSSASGGGNSVNIGNLGSSAVATKPESSSSTSKPLDSGAPAEVKKKPEVVPASTSFSAEAPPPAAEPEVLFPTCSTGAVPKRIVVRATTSPSSSSSTKRGSARGDSNSGSKSKARWASSGRIQRQASVCIPWYEEDQWYQEPQCSYWPSPPLRRLSVPARLAPPAPLSASPRRDLSGEGWSEVPASLRESASTENPGLLEQSLDRMARRLLLKSRSLEEEPTTGGSIVCYNDIGSKEAVDYEESFSSPGALTPESDDPSEEDAETVRMQYRQLWQLRATFEEEETTTDCFEELSAADAASHVVEGEEEDRRLLQQHRNTGFSTSQESEAADEQQTRPSGGRIPSVPSEVRRHNYQVLLARRLQRRVEKGSADNSFDSMETDCSSTDASRTEGGVTTSSFDSTTDNTDGGGGGTGGADGQGHASRLQQMKADSGYKSMESSNGNKPAKLSRKHVPLQELHAASAGSSGGPSSSRRSALRKRRQMEGGLLQMRAHSEEAPASASCSSNLSSGLTAAEAAEALQSSSLSSEPLGSLQQETQGKVSVFQRFFRSTRRTSSARSASSSNSASKRVLMRDFSIDPKTDALFREFSRRDPAYDSPRSCSSSGQGASPRLGSSKLLSPQLSIEEEGSEASHSAMEDDWKPQGPCCDVPIARLPTD